MKRVRAERVLSTFRGSSWPVLAEAAGEKWVVKLRGAAEGTLPLVAELVVGELLDVLSLPTPERVLVELPASIQSDDPHEELKELLARSAGLNLGFRYLEGFRNVTVADAARIAPELAARIVWVDAFVQNPDRTAKNPNLMIKAGKVCLIDHGAALNFHHDWSTVTEQSPREPGEIVEHHLLSPSEAELAEADAELTGKLGQEALSRALSRVPAELLGAADHASAERERAAYVAYLFKRLKPPRPFIARGRFVPFQIGR